MNHDLSDNLEDDTNFDIMNDDLYEKILAAIMENNPVKYGMQNHLTFFLINSANVIEFKRHVAVRGILEYMTPDRFDQLLPRVLFDRIDNDQRFIEFKSHLPSNTDNILRSNAQREIDKAQRSIDTSNRKIQSVIDQFK